ncbi:MAG: hypothetical protein ACJ77D_04560 [Chloroflexota bacterium]|jgi:hypothetical protein
MDLLTTVVVLLIAVALIGWVTAAIDGRPLEAFGSGFVGYRSDGWPQGVQEEDAVHFAPSAWHEQPSMDDDAAGSPYDPELIDLDDATAAGVPLERLR